MNAPLLLAIETSITTGGVALGRGVASVEVRLAPPVRHAEALLPAIDHALSALRVERDALDGIVVGGGPGSFTGLRIAAATAKGLAHALGRPLYAVSGLLVEAAAHGGNARRPVCAMFDARRGEVYAACYAFGAGGSIETLLAPQAADALDVVERLRAHDPLYVGEGALRNADRLGEARADLAAEAGMAGPSAAVLLALVAGDLERWRVAEPASWQPDYVRASSAVRGLSV